MLRNTIVDPTADHNFVIKWASRIGHTNIVKLLQGNRIDLSIDDNYAIKWASKKDCLDIVKILLRDNKVDPFATNNKASQFEFTEIVELLLQDKRVDPDTRNKAIKHTNNNMDIGFVSIL